MRITRRGFSIPMVVLFCAIMVLVLMAFIQTRMNMKSQTKVSFRQLKAHYLAQSGIQHALLKLRILPNESFEAACVARGICPFVPTGGTANPSTLLQPALLDHFRSDVNTTSHPISDASFNQWAYNCESLKAIMAQNEGATARVHAVEITVTGTAHTNFKGVMVDTVDEVRRVVKISRDR